MTYLTRFYISICAILQKSGAAAPKASKESKAAKAAKASKEPKAPKGGRRVRQARDLKSKVSMQLKLWNTSIYDLSNPVLYFLLRDITEE
jgi:hypothetical protein